MKTAQCIMGNVESKEEGNSFNIRIISNQKESTPIILLPGIDFPKSCNNINISIEKNAEATILLLHDSKKRSNSMIKTNVDIQENSTLMIIDCILAGEHTTIQQNIKLKEKSATAKSVVIFLGKEGEQIDIETNMWHEADKTKGDMVCNGALLGNAKVEFFGKIQIPKGVKQIESHQRMKCFTQGDKTKCDALPILDVNSNSVICSHGAAIGRVEEENVYYLESRGIEKEDAQRMILHGFLLQELKKIKQIPKETYQEINNTIKEKLRLQ